MRTPMANRAYHRICGNRRYAGCEKGREERVAQGVLAFGAMSEKRLVIFAVSSPGFVAVEESNLARRSESLQTL